MIERRTTWVIGAGASAECGLPVGSVLKGQIANLVDFYYEDGYRLTRGDETIARALFEQCQADQSDMDDYFREAHRITRAMPQAQSIDNYIDVHQGNALLERCGKLAIVRAILQAEGSSILRTDLRRGIAMPEFVGRLEKTWLTSFFQLLTENCRASQLEARLSTLTLIIFNYDRCIEHFLYCAFQNYYGLSSDEAQRLISCLSIYHPYGTAGALPWQSPLRDETIDFGGEPEPKRLLKLANKIRTFTEGTDPSQSDIQDIRGRIAQAQIVLFLGFAYHPLNLELLWGDGLKHSDPDSARFFGTAFGMSVSDSAAVRLDLARLSGVDKGSIRIDNGRECGELLRDYSRSLSLSR